MVCRTELAGCLPHFAPVHGWETRTGACVFRQIQLGNLCGSRGGETGNDVSVSPRESSSVGFCILHWQRKRGTVKPDSTKAGTDNLLTPFRIRNCPLPCRVSRRTNRLRTASRRSPEGYHETLTSQWR